MQDFRNLDYKRELHFTQMLSYKILLDTTFPKNCSSQKSLLHCFFHCVLFDSLISTEKNSHLPFPFSAWNPICNKQIFIVAHFLSASDPPIFDAVPLSFGVVAKRRNAETEWDSVKGIQHLPTWYFSVLDNFVIFYSM